MEDVIKKAIELELDVNKVTDFINRVESTMKSIIEKDSSKLDNFDSLFFESLITTHNRDNQISIDLMNGVVDDDSITKNPKELKRKICKKTFIRMRLDDIIDNIND